MSFRQIKITKTTTEPLTGTFTKGLILKNSNLLLTISEICIKSKIKSFQILLADRYECITTNEYGFSRFKNFTLTTLLILDTYLVKNQSIDSQIVEQQMIFIKFIKLMTQKL